MESISPVIFMIVIVALVLWRRMRAAARPVKGNGYRLLLPLLFLGFGILGLLNPQLHLTVKEVTLSLLFGLILSVPMIMTTNYEFREDGQIYPKKSKAFIFALVGLIVIRLALRSYLSGLDPAELGMLFYLIAVAYIVPWRIVSFVKYRKVMAQRGSALSPQ
ncbi:cytochrome c biogenesis protein CcdC [Paenibacillus elgii]|uniref:cytochrome c biogenesis protein CcdC n=1 Tax=Paenibacillus elgii TaxID=189691 RepID=UPI002D7B2A1A|nr:cytochrome c biogenesis protein CcdC [Paenibacillus elgii]